MTPTCVLPPPGGCGAVRAGLASGSNRAGALILEDKDGDPHYFFVDSSNRLRVAAAAPAAGAADVTGIVVGV